MARASLPEWLRMPAAQEPLSNAVLGQTIFQDERFRVVRAQDGVTTVLSGHGRVALPTISAAADISILISNALQTGILWESPLEQGDYSLNRVGPTAFELLGPNDSRAIFGPVTLRLFGDSVRRLAVERH